MHTKIKTYSGGYYQLLRDDPGFEPVVLMTASSFCQNQHYQIWDFRFGTNKRPSVYGDFNDWECFEITPEAMNLKYRLFRFEVEEDLGNQTWSWFRNNGILLQGCDRPFEEQTEILRRERFVWSYAAVREKLREAKEIYANLQFNEEWSQIKQFHPDLLPSSYEIKRRLKNLLEE